MTFQIGALLLALALVQGTRQLQCDCWPQLMGSGVSVQHVKKWYTVGMMATKREHHGIRETLFFFTVFKPVFGFQHKRPQGTYVKYLDDEQAAVLPVFFDGATSFMQASFFWVKMMPKPPRGPAENLTQVQNQIGSQKPVRSKTRFAEYHFTKTELGLKNRTDSKT